VPLDFKHLHDRAVTAGAYFSAHQNGAVQYALWTPPGSFAMVHMLQFSGHGDRPSAWFWQLDPATRGLHHRYTWSARVLRWGSVLAGTPLPVPEVVPTDAPLRVARWMAAAARRGRPAFLLTYVTAGVNLCRAALDAGIDLSGAKLLVTGEPITAPRAAAIRQAGAEPVPDYGSAETGLVGYGCLQPEAPDDVHLFSDLHAMVQVAPGEEMGSLRPGALLISSLRDTTSLIFINVSMGDSAVISQRKCGCPVERIGWTIHLHTIRSFEKLTAAGVTFLDVDVARVLDEVLPARFGGGPGDYQLVEREGRDGQTFLHLLVHPRVGSFDERGVADEFLRTMGQGSGGERLAAELWRETGILSVRSEPPLRTSGGKVLHLHVDAR
jgi:hypothetical protein